MNQSIARILDRSVLPIKQVSIVLASVTILALSTLTSFYPALAQTGCTPASTESGSLDTCFGAGGLVLTTISPYNYASNIAIQLDEKTVAICSGRNPSGTGTDFYAVRYDTSGNLDNTFGTGGIVRVTFTADADSEHPNAIALQPDGKILLAGAARIKKNMFGFAVARLNTDGSLDDGTAFDSTPDDSFGSGGKVLFAFSASALANDIVLQPDGKIVLAGSQGTDFAVARLNPTGTLDGTFGSGGKVTVPTVSRTSDTIGGGYAVKLQLVSGQQRIVVVGGRPSNNTSTKDFALMRFLPNGALDASFGNGGKVFTDIFGGFDRAHDLVVIGDSIIAGGFMSWDSTNGPSDFALVKYKLDGSLDTAFGTGGKVITDINGLQNIITGMALQPDGKIVAAGFSRVAVGINDFTVVRYKSDGSLDTSFGSSGIVVTDFYGQEDDPTGGVALQADGKIVVAGLSGSGNYVALARYMP